MKTAPRLACLVLASALAACSADAPTATQPAAQPATDAPRTALGRTVERALVEARQELATENISVSGDLHIRTGRHGKHERRPAREVDGMPLPDAEISPAGDLLVAGKPVPVDARQRALLLQYRGQLIDVIEVGMSLGVKGADLGMQAAGEAIKGIFSGDTDNIEQRIEAQAHKIEAEALQLCGRLPAMLATQNELATALPAFAPYATMTQQDIEDCGNENASGTQRAQIRDEVREQVRQEIRSGVRAAVGRDEPVPNDAAAEAEAASDTLPSR
ncbi:hypothetical protein ACFQZQ_01985 [Lysobacter koreensis]|uniref:DUF2884 family protein n=1 Tax=Lysobacter koreensis TaxID=266122 RepID=A0ABW2YI23_9GAMM